MKISHVIRQLLKMCMIVASLIPALSSADLVFSDDFSSVGGGSGWAGSSSWDGAGSISGGTISHSGESFRSLATPITTATMDFWVASSMALSGTSSSWGAISFFDSTDEDLHFGSDSASTTWEFGNAGVFGDQTTGVASFNQSSEAFLLAHVTSTTVDMWVDPADTSSLVALGTADASVINSPIDPSAQWDRLGIRSNGAVTITVNSLVGATTLAEAVAVPEPSGLLLSSLVLTPLLLRRRRRRL